MSAKQYHHKKQWRRSQRRQGKIDLMSIPHQEELDEIDRERLAEIERWMQEDIDYYAHEEYYDYILDGIYDLPYYLSGKDWL